MSSFGTTPQSGPGTNDHAPVDPKTSPDTEPDTDSPPTEPSLDASELEDDGDGSAGGGGRSHSGNDGGDAGLPEGDDPEQISPGP